MKCWTITRGRPIGLEPIIYLTKPEEEEQDNPWAADIQEFDDISEAFKKIFSYNDSDSYRREIRVEP